MMDSIMCLPLLSVWTSSRLHPCAAFCGEDCRRQNVFMLLTQVIVFNTLVKTPFVFAVERKKTFEKMSPFCQ